VLLGDRVLAASFAGGVYELERSSGTVISRDEQRVGVTGIAVAADPWMILVSADEGVSLWNRETHEIRWQYPTRRGAPGAPVLAGGLVLVGESEGGLLALTIAGGREVGRIESGAGFGASPSVYADFGIALSNRGTIYAFRLR
jgi:outer membrane protein assembly factor BamB